MTETGRVTTTLDGRNVTLEPRGVPTTPFSPPNLRKEEGVGVCTRVRSPRKARTLGRGVNVCPWTPVKKRTSTTLSSDPPS